MNDRPMWKNNTLLKTAKALRRQMTRHEKHLWYDFLRFYPVKIYKQRIIDRYIVDFYCHAAKLVIELDGSQHYINDGQYADGNRTHTLEQYGIAVLRFSNKDIDGNFDDVCRLIDHTIQSRMQDSYHHPLTR